MKPIIKHCDFEMMRTETCYDKTDGVAELRGRLDKIREGFESAVQPPETEFAAIQDAIITQSKRAELLDKFGPF